MHKIGVVEKFSLRDRLKLLFYVEILQIVTLKSENYMGNVDISSTTIMLGGKSAEKVFEERKRECL